MTIPAFGVRARLKIGLLGGSFNPAHDGHVHISNVALREMGLDQVWWLVSPQNPHKSTTEMAPLEKRLASARKVTQRMPRIKPCALETRLGTQYTAHSLAQLKKRYPCFQFIWLMGADNLISFHKWERWQWICQHFPVGVFHRPYYSRKSLASPASHRFRRHRRAVSKAKVLMKKQPPGWVFFSIRGKTISATQLRAQSQDWLHD